MPFPRRARASLWLCSGPALQGAPRSAPGGPWSLSLCIKARCPVISTQAAALLPAFLGHCVKFSLIKASRPPGAAPSTPTAPVPPLSTWVSLFLFWSQATRFYFYLRKIMLSLIAASRDCNNREAKLRAHGPARGSEPPPAPRAWPQAPSQGAANSGTSRGRHHIRGTTGLCLQVR